jgi:hypothetical protein
MSVIPAVRRLRQQDREFKASLDYTARPPISKSINTVKPTITMFFVGRETWSRGSLGLENI